MSIDDIDDELKCKVSDGKHWVTAIFHTRFQTQFKTDRVKNNMLLRLINAKLDDSHTLHIVSKSSHLSLNPLRCCALIG